ncbi:hypothetical protein AAC691_15510 [Nguyenibacter vanlangensis]|uniref:Bacteriophage Rz lysis protein n=1 Tax=Nguyenibacter vanlangensis TaxID=1216886 RepID=A0ABZ3D202_9PROT
MIPYLSEIKIGLGVLLLGGTFWFGYHVGSEHGAVQVAHMQAQAAQYSAKLADETAQAYRVTVDNTQANAITLADSQRGHAAADAVARSYYQSLQTQAQDDARKNTHVSGCALDADGLRIWRAANAAISDQHRAVDLAPAVQSAGGAGADAGQWWHR